MATSPAAELLVPFGFTNLESEIYVFLLGESPATGYRIAQAIGKPAANTYKAIESLRLEKGYRAFGRDLNPDLTPVEAGLVFATALDKLDAQGRPVKEFLGRDALAAHRDRLREPGERRRLISFVLEDPEPIVWGGELVLRDGEPAGQVTSAAYGATVGASVGLALLRSDHPVRQGDLDASSFHVDLAEGITPR